MAFSRRSVLKGIAAAGGGAIAFGPGLMGFARAWAQSNPFTPEQGAKLQLRMAPFAAAAKAQFLKSVEAFTAATGVAVEIVEEALDDIVPKTAVSVNTNQGPDMVHGVFSFPHLFASHALDVTDVCEDLGATYGGWAPAAEAYGKLDGRWIAVPLLFGATVLPYRISMLEKAGFSKVPEDTAGFLELMKALQAQGTPGGFALGRASADGNNWVHWALWSHGGYTVDENDAVIINSPETASALEYAKALSETFMPGAASWNDGSNNQAFLAGELSITNNATSVYAAASAQVETDPKMKDLVADMTHARMPIGPAGKPTDLHPCWPLMIMTYTKYPLACKAFAHYFMSAENYDPWLGSIFGTFTAPLTAYRSNPIFTTDPKIEAVSDAAWRSLTIGGRGKVGERAASALADFIVLDMFASVCTGRSDIPGAMRVAERQLQRIYR